MARQTLAEAFAAQAQQPQRPSDSRRLTANEALVYLNLPSLTSLYWHIRENNLPTKRIGRRYRFLTHELDLWLDNPARFARFRKRA